MNGLSRQPIEVIADWRNFPARLQGGSVSIGNFDGVHRGHQVILQQLAAHLPETGSPATGSAATSWQRPAAPTSGPRIVFTFDPHPLAILRPEFTPIPLTEMSHRANLLAGQGVDVMVVCPTTAEFLNLDYVAFFEQIIRKTLRPTRLVEGPNFYFGKDRGGNVTRLQDLCASHQIQLTVVQPQAIDGQMISSSLIRQQLQAGQIELANTNLGYCFSLCGQVVPGDQRGRQLGFPTANLRHVSTLIPKDGVYAAVTRMDGQVYRVALNIGAPLTFGKSDQRIEAHIIGLQQDLYQQWLRIEIVRRLRDTQRFDSAAQLQAQIEDDILQVAQT